MKIFFTKGVNIRGLSAKALRMFHVALLLSLGYVATGQSTSPPSGYCTTQHLNMSNNGCVNNYGFNFLKVGIDGWMHSVQCNTSTVYRYWNNMGSVITLSQGATSTMTVQTASTTYPTSGACWIDWNQDGTFSNTEYIGTNTTGTSAPTFTKSFTVPCNAIPGQTIMRFRCDYYSAVNANNGCGNVTNNYGETMDYIVTITGTANPTANYTLPDTVYTGAPAKFVNANQAGYISHNWDVINQGGTPDATTTNFTYTFPTAGTYQVRLTSANCQGQAISTKSFSVIDPTSSPVPSFVVSQNNVIYDGVTPLYIDFFDLSLYGATQWDWIITPDFMSGAPYIWSTGTNFSQNPTAFFYDVEIYDVCLAVGNSAGWDTLCKSGYINIKSPGAGSTFVNRMGQQLGSDVDSGLIYDSGGPNANYGDNEYTEFLIAPCGASKVKLTFLSFNVAANDQLLVFDGINSSAPQVGAFTGVNLPSSVNSTGGYLFLVFLSNNTGTSTGFSATWGSESPNNGAPNADFFVPDTVYQCAMGNDVIFENMSTGVLEDQVSYDWIMDYDPNVAYPTGYADVVDEVSPQWPFFSSGTQRVRLVLKSCEGNDTIVKSFIIDATSSNPIVDFTVTETILKVGAVTQLKDQSTAGCEYEWVITPNTYTIENGGSVNDRIIEVKFTAAGSYNVKMITTNDNGSTSLEKTNYIDVIEYCSPGVFYPTVADVGINKVVVGDMEKTSTSGQVPGYSDYSDDISMDLILGGTYSFEISRNTNVNGINRKIWIDFNRDGDFADANELVASETGSMSKVFSGSFQVPGVNDVVLGEARMRVGASLVNTALSACGPAQVGEYEDYTVILTPDLAAPIIQLVGSDEVIEVNKVYTDKGATAVDNLEGDITAAIVVNNGVDMSQPGVYFVTYDVTDKSGNMAATVIRKVTVVADLTAPGITLNGGNPILWSVLVPFSDPGYTTIDMPSGNNVDHLVVVTGSVNEMAIGDYTLTYTVYDDYGNKSEVTRTVQVRDMTAPTVVSASVVNIQVGTMFVDPVVADDNFDMNPQLVKISGSVNSNVIGSYTQTYRATDFSGNQSVITSVTFEVADYIAPKIHYIAGTEIVIVKVFDHNWGSHPNLKVTTSDNYYGFANLEVIYPSGFSVDVLGEYTITYKATDNGGNISTFVRVLRVIDDVKPVIITNPVNLPRWSTYDFTTGVTVTDNYYTPIEFLNELNGCQMLIIRSNVDFNYPGIYEVCYQAIDGSGNRSSIVCRTVQIGENSAATGVEDVNFEDQVSIYPNPNNGSFTIKVEAELLSNASISIINAQGKVIHTVAHPEFVNGELAIDLKGVSAGVYFVRIQNGEQAVNKKVTIQ